MTNSLFRTMRICQKLALQHPHRLQRGCSHIFTRSMCTGAPKMQTGEESTDETSSSDDENIFSEREETDEEQFKGVEGDEELEELRRALVEKDTKLKEVRAQMLRFAAEAENTRKRSEREIEQERLYANTGFAKSILTVADTLTLALKSVDEQTKEARNGETPLHKAFVSFYDGIKMTDETLHRVFKDNNIKKINCIGEKFDPKLHHVLTTVPDETKEPNTIANVHVDGYTLHDRTLRAANVITVRKD
eukprot:104258_1